MKRYRCPDCGAVHTLRPDEFRQGFGYSSTEILSSLKNKIVNHKWNKSVPRQNQQYWFRGFLFQASKKTNRIKNISVDILNKLLAENIMPASHSIQNEILLV